MGEEGLLAQGGQPVQQPEVVEAVADDHFPGVFAVEDPLRFAPDLFVQLQDRRIEGVGCGGDR